MGEILGLGISHYPRLAFEGNMCRGVNQLLADPKLPEILRTPEHWPQPMRMQWADDEGQAHSDSHRQIMIDCFRRTRDALDLFQPDVCVIWGDDQYENYLEDCVPPFSILAFDSVDIRPWLHDSRVNCWNEPRDKVFTVLGHRAVGKYLATALLNDGFDIAYAYKLLHGDLGHAFTNSVLYLDWDRKGFPYPIVPLTVNAYGRVLIGRKGMPITFSEMLLDVEEDPPSPQPWRCIQLGAATARAFLASPWKVALIASSSWSHSFLTAKHNLLYPDVESDKLYFEALCAGNWELWRSTSLKDVEDQGHHELLNWFCLVGAMAELNRKPTHAIFLESWLCNSNKVFSVFSP
jgi:hypothetical protein